MKSKENNDAELGLPLGTFLEAQLSASLFPLISLPSSLERLTRVNPATRKTLLSGLQLSLSNQVNCDSRT